MTGKEFIKQFKDYGITHDSKDKRFQHTLDFQDFVGHMNNNELYDFYKELELDEKKIFIWACTCCLSMDSMFDIIRHTTIRAERQKLYDDFDKYASDREMKLYKREETFQDCKKPIHKKIASLRSEIETLKSRLQWKQIEIENLTHSNNQFRKRNTEVETKACHFDNVRSALALILDSTV